MKKPEIVKRSYAVDISPVQRRVVLAAADDAHDFIAEALDDLPGVIEIHLSPSSREKVFYAVDKDHEHPGIHDQVLHAINKAISSMASVRHLKSA